MTDSSELKKRKAIAYVRFGAIAPLVQKTYSDDSMADYARRIAKIPLKMPDGTSRYYSPATFLRWKDLYNRDGFDALIPKTRCDKGATRSISSEAQQQILRIHEEFPRLSASQIRERLILEESLPPTTSLSTVQRYLRTVREGEKRSEVSNARERRAFEAEFPNILWQADTAYFPPILENGTRHRTYMQIILDDHSRMIVGARIVLNDNALSFQTLLKTAVQTYGIPTKLLVDNGAAYANDQLREICASVGIVLIHAKPRDPQTKGKTERVIRTCRDQFLAGLDPDTVAGLEDFNKRLQNWVREYNNSLHSTTNCAPRERFLKGIAQRPQKRPRSSEWLDECFRNRVSRKVNNDLTLQFNSTFYDAPVQFAGQRVEVWYAPDDPDDAYIRFGEERFPITRTDRIANGKAKRQHPESTVNYALEVNRPDDD